MNAMPEKLRYLVSGAWNSFFGWTCFTLIWAACGAGANLWLISAIAHLLATGQAFAVQRYFVFRQTSQSIVLQFVKFQIAYLMLLLLGVTVVNALSAQGVPPPAAQILAMALLAICGFLLGKSFTFSLDELSLRALIRRLEGMLHVMAVPLSFLALSTLAMEYYWSGGSHNDPLMNGRRFAAAMVGLHEGRLWLQANGIMAGLFNPPAFYTDLRAAFYSPAQLLALYWEPAQALHASALLFTALAFCGGYVIARRVLAWRMGGAVTLALVSVASVMVLLHFDVGGPAGPALGLWPWLMLGLCWSGENGVGCGERGVLLWPGMGVAWCLTAWLQFGSALLLPAALLMTLLTSTVLTLGRRGMGWMLLWARLAMGLGLALMLNGARLYEAAKQPLQDALAMEYSVQPADVPDLGKLSHPACLLHSETNLCHPAGGPQLADPVQREAVTRPLARHPFEWRHSFAERLLAWLSQGVFWLMATLVVLRAWRIFLRSMVVNVQRPVESSQPSARGGRC